MGSPEKTPAEQRLAISLSGSLISPEAGRVDQKYLHQFTTLSAELVSQGYSLIIVCGGGETARANIQYAQEQEVLKIDTEEELDRIGIQATHLNAVVLTHFLKERGLKTSCLLQSKLPSTKADILTTGGDKPGHTTDFVIVQLAIEQGIDTLLNLTDGPIYDRKPNGQPDGEKPIKTMTWEKYQEMFPFKHEPGINIPFDPVAAQAALDANLTVVVLDGTNLDNLRSYLEGKDFAGTIIKPE